MYCIRERGSNKLLGVSFTEDGLKFIANKDAKILMYKNAKFAQEGNKVSVIGDLTLNPKVYVTVYKRLEHLNRDVTFNSVSDRLAYQKRVGVLNKMETFWEKAVDLKKNYPKYYHLKSSR